MKLSLLLLLIVLTTQCAPFEESTQKKQCEVNGVIYGSGESVPCADNCNSCWCENGEIGTTLMQCLDDESSQSLK